MPFDKTQKELAFICFVINRKVDFLPHFSPQILTNLKVQKLFKIYWFLLKILLLKKRFSKMSVFVKTLIIYSENLNSIYLINEQNPWNNLSFSFLSPFGYLTIYLLTNLSFDLTSISREQSQKSMSSTIYNINLM